MRRSPRRPRSRATPRCSSARRRLASSGTGSRLTRFLVLERGFDSTVGLRLAADLHNLGGTPAVRSALRRFPATTEQVFHLDKFLQRERAVPIVLPRRCRGPAARRAPARSGSWTCARCSPSSACRGLDAAASGWGGGRSAVYRDAATATEAVLVALDWDSEVDAAQWATAVDGLRGAPPSATGTPTECAASACWILSGRTVAFDHLGVHTALVVSDGRRSTPASLLAPPLRPDKSGARTRKRAAPK